MRKTTEHIENLTNELLLKTSKPEIYLIDADGIEEIQDLAKLIVKMKQQIKGRE